MNFNDIDTSKIVKMAQELWEHSCMDIFFNLNTYQLKGIIYDVSNQRIHAKNIRENVNIFQSFVNTIYHDTNINDRTIKNMIADKLFTHISHEQLDLSSYKTSYFEFDNHDITVLDVNNTAEIKGSLFTFDAKKQITTTDNRKHGDFGDSYEIFELDEDGNITLQDYDIYKSLFCLDDTKTEMKTLGVDDQEEYPYCLFEFNSQGQITIRNNEVNDDYNKYIKVFNNVLSFRKYDIYETLLELKDDTIEILDINNEVVSNPKCLFEFDEQGQMTLSDTETNNETSEFLQMFHNDISTTEWDTNLFVLDFSDNDTILNNDFTLQATHSTIELDENGDITLCDVNNKQDISNNQYFILDNELNLTTTEKAG